MKEKIYESFNIDPSLYENLIADAREATERLRGLYPLSRDERTAIESYNGSFLSRFTYNSAAIEGSTLTLRDTALVLEGEFEPSDDARARDVFAAMGIRDGCLFAARAREAGRDLDEDLIRDIHERTALDCQPAARGAYRLSTVYISGSLTSTADPLSVRELMGDLVYAHGNSTEHPITWAAAFHAMFENIHPFADGNGRTGRIIMNHMLMESGYPPIAIKASTKSRYYQALEDWQVRGDFAPLVERTAECIVEEAEARCEAIEMTRRASMRYGAEERARRRR